MFDLIMRSNLGLVLMFFCILLSACSPSPQEQGATAAAQTAAAATNTPNPSETPEPTITPTLTDTPTPTPTSTPFPPFRDDFTQLLEEGWEWLYESKDGWNLAEKPGFLFVEVQVDTKQVLVRKAPEGNFEISTRLLFQPYHNFQQAGLIILQDDMHHHSFVRGMAYYSHLGEILPGNAIYFDYIDSDLGDEIYHAVGSNFGTRVDVMDEAYLRLTRVGKTYTAEYSADGEEWTIIGIHEFDIVPLYVGIRTCCAEKYLAYSYFDYFTLETLP